MRVAQYIFETAMETTSEENGRVKAHIHGCQGLFRHQSFSLVDFSKYVHTCTYTCTQGFLQMYMYYV